MHWRSKLIHPDTKVNDAFHSLAPSTHRGSTVVFDSLAQASDSWEQTRIGEAHHGRIVRLNIGLEETADLIDDLSAAFAAIR
jgi:cystathionine beta-lyase/cystathionine gamma-synthase